MASRIKIKVLGCSSNGYIYETTSSLQKDVDKWLESNPHFHIIDASTSLNNDMAIMTIKYYESIKRDLLLEKEIKEYN
jgi:hypothetical protein